MRAPVPSLYSPLGLDPIVHYVIVVVTNTPAAVVKPNGNMGCRVSKGGILKKFVATLYFVLTSGF